MLTVILAVQSICDGAESTWYSGGMSTKHNGVRTWSLEDIERIEAEKKAERDRESKEAASHSVPSRQQRRAEKRRAEKRA